MPVIVVGADTPVGVAIVRAIASDAAEVRSFITDEQRVHEFKAFGTKVATGDISDASHVEGAAMNCFCAVLVVDAAIDKRERAFAANAAAVLSGWAAAVRDAGVRRVIWVGSAGYRGPIPPSVGEVASVDATAIDVAGEVARLEGLSQLPAEE